MLVSRSPAESHLYMELHPCDCGQERFRWDEHRLLEREQGLLSVYEGRCPGCGRRRSFEFALAQGSYPAPRGFGGPRPSAIIDPGEFLVASRRAAGSVPADPAGMSAEDVEDAHDIIEFATDAVEEVLKFIPDGADAVPPEAFRSAAGRELYRRHPDQFSRRRLEAVRDAYRSVLDRYQEHAR